ncbi:MAG: restriction endonuclease subunit S [Rhodoferax sp.]|nr:restriction endonuclease subunit S [Rhodoferax sp.]
MTSDRRLRSKITQSIGDISKSIQNFGAYSLCNFINFQDEGIPFLMTKNVRENYIDWNIEKFVDQKSHEILWKSHCHRGQVLVTMAGEYLGRVAVYNSDSEASSNQAIAKISLKKGESPYTVATFLTSKFGQHQIQRFKTITGQPNINMSLIESLRVPKFSEQISEAIEALMCRVDDLKGAAFNTYTQAETLLLATLGMSGFSPETETVNIKSFKDSFASTGRLDAEYYQPKYEQQERVFSSFQQTTLADLVNAPISSGMTPKAGGDDYTDATEGVPFIRAVDISNGEVKTDNFIYIKREIHGGALRRTQLKKNDVLFSIAGTVGRCGLFLHDFDANINQAVSILRFNENTVLRLYLIAFFNSKIGKVWVSKFSRQGLQTNLNLEEVGALRIPIIDLPTQQKIAVLVQQSFTLKAQSKRLLEAAKRAVEIAIEQDEAAGMAYLAREAGLP